MKPEEVAVLLRPYVKSLTIPDPQWAHICEQLVTYLDLILRWNTRTNLTAIRTPEEIVQRHFGESLFAGAHIGNCSTLLDFGSGAGFPGIPIQLLHPEIQVTLAESQGKKAAFLREVCRELSLPTEVFASRVEQMPGDRQFDVVTLRAVDNMPAAVLEATPRARHRVMLLTTQSVENPPLSGFSILNRIALPNSVQGTLEMFDRKTE